MKARIFGLGAPELLVIGVVAAVAFGPSKLPELGQALGKTVKSFQTAAEVRSRGGSVAERSTFTELRFDSYH